MKRPLVLAIALLASGCGLFLQTDPPGMDAGPLPDSGRGDAGLTDSGRRDAGPACVQSSDCRAPASDCERVTCDEGVCVVTSAVCDDGIACTVDRCLPPGSGARCEFEPGTCAGPGGCLDTVCDPTRGCVDVPIDGACAPDTYECTVEYCDAEGLCQREFDHSMCEGADSRSQCAPDSGLPFDPATGCTRVECEPGDDCIPDGPCAGSGVCTAGQCVFTPVSNTPCTLGNRCATGECRGGICQEVSRRDCNGPCQGGSCNPATGECQVSDDDGSICDDGSPCTVGTCTTGQCLSGPTCAEMGDAMCVDGSCIGDGCVFSTSYCQASEVCTSGVCECRGGFTDCNNDNFDGCECPVGMGASCSATNVCNFPTPDGGRPDAGPPRPDSGSCEADQIADATGYCDTGSGLSQDCDGDGCCECDRNTSYCSTDGGSNGCLLNIECTVTLPDGGVSAECPVGEPCCPCTGDCDAACPCPMTGPPPEP